MLQILREQVAQPRLVRGMFMDFGNFFDDRGRTCEALHVQGSAAVFVLEMDLPLSFSPAQPDANEATQEPVDPVWQRVRQSLYMPDRTLPGISGRPGETQRLDFRQFQEDLLQTLRHAANLRHVEPNEAVVVTVVAREESAGWPAGPASAGGSFPNSGGGWFEGGSYSTSSATFGSAGGNTRADSQSYSRSPGSGSGPRPSPVSRMPPGSAPVIKNSPVPPNSSPISPENWAGSRLAIYSG